MVNCREGGRRHLLTDRLLACTRKITIIFLDDKRNNEKSADAEGESHKIRVREAAQPPPRQVLSVIDF